MSFVAIYNWVKRYVMLIGEYVSTLTPQLSGQWNVDEMKVKVAGEWRWLWNVMDKETRFLVASAISEKREAQDARRVSALAKARANGKRPKKVITDGLPAYKEAFKKEFFTLRGPRTEHISHIRLAGDMNNNIMERLQGTNRERDKVLRGMKSKETPIREGFDIYYNFVRPHMGLNGLTPAQASGLIDIDIGTNKWLGLLKKGLAHQPDLNTTNLTP